VIGIVLIVVLAPLWAVDMVFLVEVVLGLAPSRRRPLGPLPGRIAVLTPAHNEGQVIRASITAIRAVLPPGTRQLVVVHNCTDNSAEEARAGGAEIAILDRADQRGKGYALAFGRDQLASDPPDVVIVIDADCTAEAGSIDHLARMTMAHGSAVQSCYLFRSRPDDAPIVQISNFAMLVKNLIRQRGGQRIGAPALMTGSGMAFPWARFAALDLATGNIVEDLAIGVELVEAGAPPAFAEQARIWSSPSSTAGTQTQRARWEGGFMATARTTGVPLLLRGLRGRSWSRVWMGLHLLVPPLTLVVMVNLCAWLALAIARFLGGPAAPFVLSSILLAAILAAVLAAWAVAGRAALRGRTLLRLPLYVLWKLALYARLVRRNEKVGWVRTERVD
jgi:cellulose synthase/poly-beta-1,6-N-acetylglucosamine synthase-like glycosyltransferase